MKLFKSIYEKKKRSLKNNRRLHMANERTFLAWIRTSIGIIALGFVIEKFMIPLQGSTNEIGLFDIIGLFIVISGALVSILSTYRFLKSEKDIAEDSYCPSVFADIMVAILVGSIGLSMVVYLILKI